MRGAEHWNRSRFDAVSVYDMLGSPISVNATGSRLGNNKRYAEDVGYRPKVFLILRPDHASGGHLKTNQCIPARVALFPFKLLHRSTRYPESFSSPVAALYETSRERKKQG